MQWLEPKVSLDEQLGKVPDTKIIDSDEDKNSDRIQVPN